MDIIFNITAAIILTMMLTTFGTAVYLSVDTLISAPVSTDI